MFFLTKTAFNIARRICTSQQRAITSTCSYTTQKPEMETRPLLPNDESSQRLPIFDKVNNLIKSDNVGKLFAVVHLCGKQFKITDGDIIVVEGNWPPTSGDRIRLDKVLLAGGKDFTLIGTPILQPNLVEVQATIVEKTLSHTKTHFRKKRRKQYMRTNFFRPYHTMLRINSIEIRGLVNQNVSSDSARRIF